MFALLPQYHYTKLSPNTTAPPMVRLCNMLLFFQGIPAPGHYQIKSQFQHQKVEPETDHTALVAPFGSQARVRYCLKQIDAY